VAGERSTMNLGPYAAYVLPPDIRRAWAVDTAQGLADLLGVCGQLTPDLLREAQVAYTTYRAGDVTAIRAFLTHRLRTDDAIVADLMAKLP
jgi:hypothetical protein